MSFELGELDARIAKVRADEDAANQKAAEFDQKGRTIGHVRGVTFLAALLATGSATVADSNQARLVEFALGAALFGAFLWLIKRHDRCLQSMGAKEREAAVLRARRARQEGRFDDLIDTGSDLGTPDHPYAADLDLFGTGSLFQRVSTAHTHFGRETLAAWLKTPAPVDSILRRQEAVQELSEQDAFRVSLEHEARALVQLKKKGKVTIRETPDPGALLRWIESPPGLPTSAAYRALCTLIPICTLIGITASTLFGAAPFYWLVPLAAGLVILSRAKDVTGPTFGVVSQTEGSFLPYAELLRLIEGLEAKAPLTRQLLEELHRTTPKSALRASQEMGTFRNLVSWYDIRHNGMVYPFIEATLLWSIHSTLRLEAWKRNVGGRARRWFEILGEVEALCSFAELLALDPMARLPEIKGDGASMEAEELGHPLIPARSRKSNDLPPLTPSSALLITGSNMSGKSTFLRALGVNAVLALGGGPVTATRFALPPLVIRTSLRVDDSLLSGTSHFFAEVKKLKRVVESAQGSERVLFLLDEVLHGTNSRERIIGARWVLAELLRCGAFGIMTTHDEGLTELEGELANQVRLFHFREDVSEGKMTFDYQLRPGPVRSGNALRLMHSVGLGVPLEEPPV